MLYNFLTSDDLDRSIKEELLDQLVRGDLGLVALSENAAVSWMKDYLGQRYDVAATFPNIGEWSAGNDYGPARPVPLPGTPTYGCGPDPIGLAFYTRPETPPPGTLYTPLYVWNAAGRLTNYAWHDGLFYEALTDSVGIAPDTAGTTAWRVRDPRDPKVVMFCVDITLFNLHKRVAPRKISELRVSLYNAAKEWLTLVSEGTLTPDLPRPIKAAENSDTIRWGSQAQQSHHY